MQVRYQAALRPEEKKIIAEKKKACSKLQAFFIKTRNFFRVRRNGPYARKEAFVATATAGLSASASIDEILPNSLRKACSSAPVKRTAAS
jgi:hypothetical protein